MSEHESGHGIDEDEIRQRAYEISQGPEAGGRDENWHRAVEELLRERESDERSGGEATDDEAS
jgi:hypothetical protein